MLGYAISCVVFCLILVAFIPAMIAAHKSFSFKRWYFYGLLLFPVALIHSIVVQPPVRIITVYSSGKDRTRKKKSYRAVPVKKEKRKKHTLMTVLMVFATKLIFGAFVAFSSFALSRTYIADGALLRITCVVFAFLVSIAMTVTELMRFSRGPVIADEMSKRALVITAFSVVVSAIMSAVKILITANVSRHHEFFRFLCTLVAFIVFVYLIINMQRGYYRRFSRFTDYCMITVGAYVMYAAVMLVMLSMIKEWRFIVYSASMPMQLFNFSYFSDIKYIDNMSAIYAAASVHAVIIVLILLSGWQCCNYKKREFAYRVEYRTKAFRMSRRPVLRRHIVNTGLRFAKPLKQ